jgi:hypothetical protein
MTRRIACVLVLSLIATLFLSIPTTAVDITDLLHQELIKTKIIQETETEPLVFDVVPLYNQLDYAHIPYGEGHRTIATSGCGITCLAMVATYLTDTVYTPAELAARFASRYAWHGTSASIFPDSEELLGLKYDKTTYSWDEAYAALQNGQVIVTLVSAGNIFTNGGHYIVLAGLTETGKIIVNDPNGANYTKLANGFKNGFYPEDIAYKNQGYFIYARKDAPLAEITNGSVFAKEFVDEDLFNYINKKLNAD